MPASTRGTEARKLPSTAWRPGQSGNPRGRPKAPFDIAALCREHAPEAVATLVAALKDPRHKVAAAEALLNRGFGKPAQSVSIESHAAAVQLHLLAARGVSTELLQELGISPPAVPQPKVIDLALPPTE
jgi:hypothetical protein